MCSSSPDSGTHPYHTAVCSSSPDRGVLILITQWCADNHQTEGYSSSPDRCAHPHQTEVCSSSPDGYSSLLNRGMLILTRWGGVLILTSVLTRQGGAHHHQIGGGGGLHKGILILTRDKYTHPHQMGVLTRQRYAYPHQKEVCSSFILTSRVLARDLSTYLLDTLFLF